MIERSQFHIIAILVFCIMVILLSIAYALMNDSIVVSNSSYMEATTWDVYFDKVSASTVGKADYSLPAIEGTTLRDFSVSFQSFGDSVTFEFKVVNAGNTIAQLGSIVLNKPVCKSSISSEANFVCSELSYKISYDDGKFVREGDLLEANSFKTIKYTIEYPSTANRLPKAIVDISNLGIDLVYHQT